MLKPHFTIKTIRQNQNMRKLKPHRVQLRKLTITVFVGARASSSPLKSVVAGLVGSTVTAPSVPTSSEGVGSERGRDYEGVRRH